jgi:CRISPR-associated protein Cas5t
MDPIALIIDVPICSFRKGSARSFLESEEFPPPSTVYGCLLSLIGEEDRHAYIGTELALAVEELPRKSVVLRKTWRMKERVPPGTGVNAKPDLQELLTDVRLRVWVRPGQLASRVADALRAPGDVVRYGGLSLGESHDLVNGVSFVKPDEPVRSLVWLERMANGRTPVTVWVDHVGAAATRWQQAECASALSDRDLAQASLWFRIGPEVT